MKRVFPAHRTLAAAFANDPMFTYVLPDPTDRQRRLELLFAGSVRHAARHGGVASVDDGAGVALWTDSAHMTVSFVDAARSGLLTLPLRVGVGAMTRLQRHEAAAEAVIERVTTPPFGYLMALGADPRRRGTGVGRRAVDAALAQMRSAELPRCVLRTENAANVGLYEHLGFRLLITERVAASGLSVHVFERSTDRTGGASGTM